jgi:hypothetical protein
MKITVNQLRNIIKEELRRVIREAKSPNEVLDVLNKIHERYYGFEERLDLVTVPWDVILKEFGLTKADVESAKMAAPNEDEWYYITVDEDGLSLDHPSVI